jgi:hypothetical protein
MDGGGDLLSLAFPGQQPLEHADEPGQGSTPFNGAVVLKPFLYGRKRSTPALGTAEGKT